MTDLRPGAGRPPAGPRAGERPMGGGFFGGRGMAMAMPVAKARNFRGTLRRLLGHLRPHRATLAAVGLMALLGSAFGVVGPKLLGRATTLIFEGARSGAGIDYLGLLHLLAGLAGLFLVSSLFVYLQQRVMVSVSQKVAYELRQSVSAKLARLPLRYLDHHSHGDLLSRVTNDAENVGTTLQQTTTQLLSAAITVIGTVAMMLTISPLLTLVASLTLPVFALVTRVVAARARRYFAEQQQTLGELSGHVEEMYTGHAVVKAFGRERESVRVFADINQRLYRAGWKAHFLSGLLMPVMSFLNSVGFVAICITGGLMAARGALAVGDIQAFIQYVRHLGMPVMQIASMANVIQSAVASAERIFEVLDETEEPGEAVPARHLVAPRGAVSLQDVRFSYVPERPLIEGLSIDIAPGQTVAIVGPTGAGKTTLVNLLMRFYDIAGGAIRIDGVDVRELPRGELRGLFGMVLQETWLFHGTIHDNIAFGREGASSEEVIAAARAAHADHFIRTLPDGYATPLNEEASNLSQGQKQLLTIARAILADPTVLILDEATSSVDTRTEVQVRHAMLELRRGRTCFVVAHRLSTVRDADLILVMDRGRIVEQGTHLELLARGTFYAELYNSQFAPPDTASLAS